MVVSMSSSGESASDDMDDSELSALNHGATKSRGNKMKGSYLKTKGAKKRGTPEEQDGQHSSSKAKKPRPISTEEINTLFETENLYHSHLFRMQLEELIKETRYKSSEALDEWFADFKERTLNLDKMPSYKMDGDTCENVVIPMEKVGSFSGKWKIRGKEIHSLVVTGSHVLNTAIGESTVIDLFAPLHEEDFCYEDMMNHRWARKKALYLAWLASHFKQWDSISRLQFSYQQGSPLRPCLLVTPAASLQRNVQYQIIPVIKRKDIGWRKLGPDSSNVQSEWLSGSKRNESPTPLYNASIVQDLVWEQTMELCKSVCSQGESITDSIKLLKLWLQQRELTQGLGGFSGHLMTMVVCYLVQKNSINARMSNYQILRNVWNFIGNSQWETEGISLCSRKHKVPEMSSFGEGVKVIDPTGYLNYAASLLPQVYEQVREESLRALDYLKLDSKNSFEALFMFRVPFNRKHDIVLRLESSSGWKEEIKKLGLEDELLDMGYNCGYLAMTSIVNLLRRGLGQRISSFGVSLKNSCWDVDESPTSISQSSASLGFVLDSTYALDKLVIGAEANSLEAAHFKELWGELSQLRRFRDGGIHEAVLWDAKTVYDRRYITARAASYLLDLHVGVTTNIEANFELLDVLDRPCVKTTWNYNSGEEAGIKVKAALDSLSTDIRTLADLPLQISSVSGTCPSSRYCEVFPQLHSASKLENPITKVRHGQTYLKNSMMSPPWLQPIKVQVMLESSGKWPEDLGAIRRVKAAFHIEIAKAMKSQLKILAQPYPDKVRLVKDGYIFDVYVAHLKEISLLKQMSSSSKTETEDATLSEAWALERRLVHLPKLSSSLSGLHTQTCHCFGTCCRLAKRWLASQLVLEHLGEMTVELLVASLFTSTQPYPPQPPVSPVVAFLRFLSLLADTDFQSTPIIVNFNDELTKDDVTDIHQRFISSRETFPALFIATSHEHLDSIWTLDSPSAVLLHRVKQLASQALVQVEKESKPDWLAIFRPPMSIYNVQIHLRSVHLPRWHQALTKSKTKGDSSSDYSVLPVCEYDPAQLYLRELQDSFGDLALFFHDRFGGSVIGVLWKPSALANTQFKVSNLAWRCPSNTTVKGEYGLTPNMEAVLDDFKTLGKGLIKSIEIKH